MSLSKEQLVWLGKEFATANKAAKAREEGWGRKMARAEAIRVLINVSGYLVNDTGAVYTEEKIKA